MQMSGMNGQRESQTNQHWHGSVSPMPPPNAAISQSNTQTAANTIVNHNRRKQFRNMPAGSKLEQI